MPVSERKAIDFQEPHALELRLGPLQLPDYARRKRRRAAVNGDEDVIQRRTGDARGMPMVVTCYQQKMNEASWRLARTKAYSNILRWLPRDVPSTCHTSFVGNDGESEDPNWRRRRRYQGSELLESYHRKIEESHPIGDLPELLLHLMPKMAESHPDSIRHRRVLYLLQHLCCPVQGCGVKLNSEEALLGHMAIHQHAPRQPCSYCGLCFHMHQLLCEHIERVHPQAPPESLQYRASYGYEQELEFAENELTAINRSLFDPYVLQQVQCMGSG